MIALAPAGLKGAECASWVTVMRILRLDKGGGAYVPAGVGRSVGGATIVTPKIAAKKLVKIASAPLLLREAPVARTAERVGGRGGSLTLRAFWVG